MVQAVILAGGAGTRLRPLTDRLPKPMVPTNGRPFLEHLMEYIAGQGVDEVLICTGYLHEVIEEHFSLPERRVGMTMEFSRENEFLGTGGALLLARDNDLLRPEFLLLNGDSYFPLDFESFMDRYRQEKKHGVPAMISVYNNRNPRICPDNLVVDDSCKRVLLYDKSRELDEMNGVEAGTSIFDHRIFDFMPPLESLSSSKKCSLEMEVYPHLIARGELASYCTNQRFYDMGTPDGLRAMEEVLKS